MKSFVLLSALALGNAFVLPDEQVFSELAVEQRHKAQSLWNKVPSPKELAEKLSNNAEHFIHDTYKSSLETFDSLVEAADDEISYYTDKAHETAFDVKGWLAPNLHEEPPHDGPHDPPHHGPPHHGHPHDPHHGHKPNLTVYQLISKSKYSTKLAKLINEYDDLVELLNGTSANFTVFAPTDKAFDKIPKDAPKPSKEFLKKLLTYHVSTDFYPARRVLGSDTIPTAYKEDALGGQQRIAVKLGLKGVTFNFYAGLVAPNIFGTNGVIHGIESILVPPPPTGVILDLLPGEFSTLLLALIKTGFGEELNNTAHVGGTLFAPNNFAFQKLGPGPNAFLFSQAGLKYLKALLKYHAVVNQTLYSDAFYKGDSTEELQLWNEDHKAPYVHVDLPTLLDGKTLPVDIRRYGPFISVRVNAYSRVIVKNGVAKDGVIHVVGDVLIPPKKLAGQEEEVEWDGKEMTVEELKERFAPYVSDDEDEKEVKMGIKHEF